MAHGQLPAKDYAVSLPCTQAAFEPTVVQIIASILKDGIGARYTFTFKELFEVR